MQTSRLAGALLVTLLFALGRSPATAQSSQKAVPKASALFAQNCATCHGSDGRGGERAPNIATRQDVVSMPDARLRAIISDGIPSAGMPSFSVLGEKQVDSVLAYLRVLQGMTSGAQAPLPGDPKAGEALFFAADSCARCHTVEGRGGFMGSDLSAFARGRTVAFVENAIVHPPNRVGDKNHAITVETDRGVKITGLVRTQTNFTLVLQTEDGVFHSLSRESIRSQTVSPHTYMPDYQNLSKAQLDNLASFLLQAAASPATPGVIPATDGSR